MDTSIENVIECCAESTYVCRCTVKGKFKLFDSNGHSTGKYICGRHVDHKTICGSRARMKQNFKICLDSEITVPLQTCCAQTKKVRKCTEKGEYELFDSRGQSTEKYVCSRHADKSTICGPYARIQGNVYESPKFPENGFQFSGDFPKFPENLSDVDGKCSIQ